MKLLLDTTYLIPFMGVEVERVKRESIESTLKEHQIQISEVQFFELFAKGNKLGARGLTGIEEVIDGIESLYHSLEVLPLVEPDVLKYANLIYRHGLKDIIDSIILASALRFSEGLATLDQGIRKAYEGGVIRRLNPNLKILKL